MGYQAAPAAPIFVVAYPHSGTTMLREALSRSPEIFSCNTETKFFERFPEIERRFLRLEDPAVRASFVRFAAQLAVVDPDAYGNTPTDVLDDAEVTRLSSADGDHVALFAATLNHLAAREGRARWLEKTPEHIFAIDHIRTALPEAIFVELVRSPLDALASKKFRQGISAARRVAGRAYKERFFHPVWDALTWRAAVTAGGRAARAPGVSIVRLRYEDLVDAPEQTLRRLCDQIGIRFVTDMLDVRRQNASRQTGNETRGVSRKSVGRWSKDLTPGEIALIGLVTRATAKPLGYDLPRGRPDGSAVRWVGRTIADPLARVASHARRGGWRSALHAVHGYVRRSRAR